MGFSKPFDCLLISLFLKPILISHLEDMLNSNVCISSDLADISLLSRYVFNNLQENINVPMA